MTTTTMFSLIFSGCFMSLLVWGGSHTVDGLLDEHLTMQPATTTTEYHSRYTMTDNTTYGEADSYIACGNNSHNCLAYCHICMEDFGALTMDCLSTLNILCLHKFESHMISLNSTDWCIWDIVRGAYSNLSRCTEDISDCLQIPWPNPLVEETFVDIHSFYFKDCPTEELSDPPPVIVFALVITPICLIPVMVSLVVFKTKNGDGSS